MKILTDHQAWAVAQAKANLAEHRVLKEARARELLTIIDDLTRQLAAEKGVSPVTQPARGRSVTLSDAEREDLFGD